MFDKYAMTMDYDMIVSLGKGWFQITICCLDHWNMSLTYVFSYKETWFAQQGKIIGILLDLFMHWQWCVIVVWYKELHGK